MKKILQFLADWRNAVSFAIAWLITNGWGYIFLALGPLLKIKWMTYVGSAYIAFLWLPFTPEKLVTIPLALLIKKIIFRRRTCQQKQKDSQLP